MVKEVWLMLRRVLSGRGLGEAMDRNQKAADELDGLLREVLRR